MFARGVSVQLTANGTKKFTHTLENEITALLRKQKGFQDEIILIAPGGLESGKGESRGKKKWSLQCL